MKKYKIMKSRDESLIGKLFIETDEENSIEGNIFFGSWTDDLKEYNKDDTIIIFVMRIREIQPISHREKVNFNISPFGGYRFPVRVPVQ